MSRPTLGTSGLKAPTSHLARPLSSRTIGSTPGSSTSEITAHPPSDFAIGDRVWVGGTKEGVIAFIGPTEFSDGEWVGVVLEEPQGKNNGSVKGVVYFECPENHGLFSRMTNIQRQPSSRAGSISNLSTASSTSNLNRTLLYQQNNNAETSSTLASKVTNLSQTMLPPAVERSPLVSANGPEARSTPAGSNGIGQLRVGERVMVSGNRAGTLRFLGATDFAKGQWAGVELDDETGKNDGAVNDTRYFTCKANYGLFAPIHKVNPVGVTPALSSSNLIQSARKPSISGLKAPAIKSMSRSGSNDSISSIASNVSSASRSRVRLGVTSISGSQQKLTGPTTTTAKRSVPTTPSTTASSRSTTLSTTGSVASLQKVLKEKEQHIEQLLKERDLERSEVARAAAQAEDAESQAATWRLNCDRITAELHEVGNRLEDLERSKAALMVKYEEEKRKVEDLQFQMEEENIDKSTLETKTEEDESKIFELEEALANEREVREAFEVQLTGLKEKYEAEKKKAVDAEGSAVAYLEGMEAMRAQVASLETQLRTATDKIEDESTKQLLLHKEEQIEALRSQLTELEAKLVHSENKLVDMQEDNKAVQSKREKQETSLADLQTQITRLEETNTSMTKEKEEQAVNLRSVEDTLASMEAKNVQLSAEKDRLEKEFAEMMKNSGDSSQQLSALNDQLRSKTQELQTTQDQVQTLQQQIRRVNEEMESEVKRREVEMETIRTQNEARLKELEQTIAEQTTELDTNKKRAARIEEGYQQEKSSLLTAHEAAVSQLSKQVAAKEEELVEQKALHDQNMAALEEMETDMNGVKQEISRLEVQLRKSESEKVEIIQTKRQAIEERDSLSDQLKNITVEMTNLRDELVKLTADRDTAIAEKHASQKQHIEVKAQHDEISMRLEKVTNERTAAEQRLAKLEAELEKRMETADMSAKERIQQMDNELEQLNRSLSECRHYIDQLESEKSDYVRQVSNLKSTVGESVKLQEERDKLQSELNEMKQVISSLETRGQQSIADLEGKTNQLRLLQDRLIKINKEHEDLQEKHRTTCHDLESQKRVLTDKLKRSQIQLDEAEKKARLGGNDTEAAQKEATERQIDFLNSIIGDLQRKNLDLEKQIEILTDTALPDMNGDANHSGGLSRQYSLRPYCDICEAFDLHETEDCPQQSGSQDGVKHGGVRGEERPYCESCGSFGHVMADCTNDEEY